MHFAKSSSTTVMINNFLKLFLVHICMLNSILVLHGTPSKEIAFKIAETGFAALALTDGGYFGKGLTFSNVKLQSKDFISLILPIMH